MFSHATYKNRKLTEPKNKMWYSLFNIFTVYVYNNILLWDSPDLVDCISLILIFVKSGYPKIALHSGETVTNQLKLRKDND